jgi:hypothetical protein
VSKPRLNPDHFRELAAEYRGLAKTSRAKRTRRSCSIWLSACPPLRSPITGSRSLGKRCKCAEPPAVFSDLLLTRSSEPISVSALSNLRSQNLKAPECYPRPPRQGRYRWVMGSDAYHRPWTR